MKIMNRQLLIITVLLILISCRKKESSNLDNEQNGRTPVTVTHPVIGTMTESTDLNATSVFLLKTTVKASLEGYIEEVNIRIGQSVKKGDLIFVLRSKEAVNLGNTVSLLDSSLHSGGRTAINSPENGYITQLNFVAGDYVLDGESLATISSNNSLVFLLDLPFELKPYLSLNRTVEISLTDGRKISGVMSSPLPSVDPVSQTQSYIVRIPADLELPENLIAKLKYIKKTKEQTIILPEKSVLTNEMQSEFWIMKMTDSVTAVRVNIIKGIEMTDRIEILAPTLLPDDVVLLTGNYGLPDTASVRIVN